MLLNLNRRRAALILIVLIGIVTIILWVKPSRPASVVLLPEDTRLPPKDSLVPGSWGWYWSAKEFIFGTPPMVMIGITVLHIEGVNEANRALLPAAVKTATNLQIYFINTNDVAKLRGALASSQSTSSEYGGASITTGEGIRVTIIMGPTPNSSISVKVIARRRGPHTDLLTSIQATGLRATGQLAMRDLNVATRLQIPKDHAALILKSYATNSALVGVFLTPRWQ